jgi:hypothetical protein
MALSGRKFFPFKNVIIPSCVAGVCLTLYPTQGNESAKINLTVCQIILSSVLKNSIFKLPQEKCHSRSCVLGTPQQHAALFIRVVSVNEEVLTLMIPL